MPITTIHIPVKPEPQDYNDEDLAEITDTTVKALNQLLFDMSKRGLKISYDVERKNHDSNSAPQFKLALYRLIGSSN